MRILWVLLNFLASGKQGHGFFLTQKLELETFVEHIVTMMYKDIIVVLIIFFLSLIFYFFRNMILAERCVLLSAEILKSQSKYSEAAALLIRLTSEVLKLCSICFN